MKIVTKLAHVINVFALGAITAFTATHVEEARAQDYIQNVNQEQMYCLVQNIFFESRNQSEVGQKAVAWVTLNRVESERYPNTICEVVWQDSAFSWTNDGLSNEPSNNVLEKKAWNVAKTIAHKTMIEWVSGYDDPTSGADHYHADYVRPYWAKDDFKTVSIDNHIFYKLY